MNFLISYLVAPYQGFCSKTWKLILAGFINASNITLSLYISLYLSYLGFNVSEIGIGITIFGLGGLIGAYLSGILIDRLGPLKVCKFSLLTSFLIFLLLPLKPNYTYIICCVGLISVCVNLLRPAFILALTDEKDEFIIEKTVALRRVAVNLGMSFGAMIMSYIMEFGFRYIFILNGIACLLAFAILSNVKEPINKTKQLDDIKKPITRDYKLFLILFFMLITMIIFNQLHSIYPIYLKDFIGLEPKFISMMFALNGILIALFQMPITHSLSKINNYSSCCLGAFLITFGLSMLAFINQPYMIIISCIVLTLGEIIFFPAILTEVILLSGEKKGRKIGVYQIFYSLSMLLAPFLGTTMYQIEPNLIWYISLVFGSMSAVLFYLVKRI